MNNLYLNYRGDNPNHQASSANRASQQPIPQPKSDTTSIPLFPGGATQRLQARASSEPTSAQAKPAGLLPTEWADDQTIQQQPNQQHPSHTPQQHSDLASTAHPRIQTSRTTANSVMNGTRTAPLGTRRPPQYEDSLAQMMGKVFTDKGGRGNMPVSSIALQGPPQGTLDQYQQIRSAGSSNVFDPNDFPSLGGGVVAGQSGLTTTTTSLLRSTGLDSSAISGLGVSSSSANGLASYESMYGIGSYGDGRAKAVDAVTGGSAASEFSMHNEDFPALGGNSVHGSLPHNVLGNGPGGPNLLGNSIRMGAIGTSSGEKLGAFEGYPSINVGRSINQQLHGTVGRGIIRPEQSITGLPVGRATQTLADFQGNQSRANPILQSVTRNTVGIHDKVGEDGSRFPGKPEFPSKALPPGKMGNGESFTSIDDRKGPEDIEVLGGNERPSQRLPSTDAKSIPNGDAHGLTGLPSSTSARGRNHGPSTALSRTVRSNRREGEKKIESILSPDHYGMKGLLRYVGEEAEGTDANMLSIGVDLTMLGLDLNQTEPLYKTFVNPWEGGQGGVFGNRDPVGPSQKNEEPDYKLPTCYYMQPPALKNSHFTKFQLETLFYVFYNMPRDVLQVLAAIELYNRKWRYHKDLKLWFTCEPEALQGYERGAYIYFDIKSWEQRPFHDANQSFIQGLMTEDELRSVPIPGQRPSAS